LWIRASVMFSIRYFFGISIRNVLGFIWREGPLVGHGSGKDKFMVDVKARYDAAKEIAEKAGEEALRYFRAFETLKIDKKGHQDLVSEGDRNVELLVRAEIAAVFPDDGIVGEEHDSVDGTSGFTWVIDPIDGTANFVRGIPAWCVAIAVVRGADTVIGVIHDPVHDEMHHAMRDGGAFINDNAISVATDADITDGSIGIGFSARTTPEGIQDVIAGIMSDGGVFYRNASGALSLAYVACGKLLGYIEEHMNAWDCIAGQLIVAEAGGVIEDQDAADMVANGGRVVAGAPGVWDDVLRIANKAYG
jgi:myo-inositol-1(or 4)-monophosphatase